MNKILYAKKSLPENLSHFEYKIVKIDDLHNLANISEFVYRKISESIFEKGMMWPITVCKYENHWNIKLWKKPSMRLGVTNGNQRVYYAKQNGYTHIQAIEVMNKEERDKINDIVYTSPYEYPK